LDLSPFLALPVSRPARFSPCPFLACPFLAQSRETILARELIKAAVIKK